MRRLTVPFALAAAVTLTATATTASANPQTIPNGPWVQDRQQVKLERLHSYDQLVDALDRIERSSQGRVSVETIGQSNEGRDLFLAQVGNGPRGILYITQQHGDEPLGTEAALQLLQRLGNPGAEWSEILDEVTLFVVPRVNPDGGERSEGRTRWRQNFHPDCEPGPGQFCAPGRGYDINRWHDPAVDPDDNPVPEAAAVQRVFQEHRPDMVVDFHHQGTYVSDDGKMIKTSIFWPRDISGMPPEAIELSKQMNVVVYDTLTHYGFAEVSQYPGGTQRGIARNAYGLQGAGSMLVELRGQTWNHGQKSSGMLIRTAYVIMASLLEASADGTVDAADPDRADDIPLRGPFVTNPTE